MRHEDAVALIHARQADEAERRLVLVLDDHQSRSGRPIAGLIADMAPDLLADLHQVCLDTGQLHRSVFDVCRCRACDHTRRLGDAS